MAKAFAIIYLCILTFGLVKCQETNKEKLEKEQKEFRDQCIKEVGATQVDMMDLAKQKPLKNKVAKCMQACIMRKYKVLDSDGKFVKSTAMEHVRVATNGNEDKMKLAAEIIDACNDIQLPSDHCEAPEVLIECFEKHRSAELKF